MNKKLMLLLALAVTTYQTSPWRHGWGGGWGWGAPYGYGPYGYGYGYSPAADIIGTAAVVGTSAALASASRPKSDAEVDYERDKDRARDIKRQIKVLNRNIERAQKNGQNTTELIKQRKELQDNL